MTNINELADSFLEANARPIGKILDGIHDDLEDFVMDHFPKVSDDDQEAELLDLLEFRIAHSQVNFEGLLLILSNLPAIPLDAKKQLKATLKEHFPNS